MKFWVKTVLCSVLVFMAGLDIVAYVLIQKSYSLNLESEYDSAANEQFFIRNSLYRSLRSTEGNYTHRNAENLRMSLLPYTDYYRQQGIYLELYLDDKPVYSGFTGDAELADRPELAITPGESSRLLREVGGTLYLFTASYMDEPYSNMKFVYIKNEQRLIEHKQEITTYFITVSIVAAVVLTLVTIALVWRLTRPLRDLNKATSEIANGDYSKRVAISTRDEIGDFAASFNTMASSVESHVARLSELTAEKQRFIDNLAHEMRTPITAIMGYGEFLKVASYTEEERIKALDYMISQSGRIQRMTLKLLELAGLRENSVHFEQVNVVEILNQVEATLAGRLRDKEIVPVRNLDVPKLWGDAVLLESLLTNLMENALRALPAGGSLEVSTYTENGRTHLEVQDTGRGIPADELEKIKEPFYRVDRSRSSREGGGAGLGLALCERICMLHHAEMRVVSLPDQGTTVIITFYNSMTTSERQRC